MKYSIARPFQLLYAEDDVNELKLFSDAVSASNLPFDLFNAKDAFDIRYHLMNGFIPNAILLDLHLPFFNPLDFVKELKSNELYKDTPIIIFSSYPLHRYFNSCIEAGASTYLVKPAECDKWIKVVEKLLLQTYNSNVHKKHRFKIPLIN